jgi:hypothetical protein
MPQQQLITGSLKVDTFCASDPHITPIPGAAKEIPVMIICTLAESCANAADGRFSMPACPSLLEESTQQLMQVLHVDHKASKTQC